MSAGVTTTKLPRWLVIASNIRHNYIAKVRFSRGNFEFEEGSTHWGWPLEKSLEYVHLQLNDYVNYASLPSQAFLNKRILELGPGDNLGVALKLLAAGASQVVALDKFFSKRDDRQQIAIYAALRAELSPNEQARFDAAVSLNGEAPVFNEALLRYVYGIGAEDADSILEPESFDFIISRGVLLEIPNCDQAFRSMDKLLRPGGMMIHKAPCLDWMFPQNGHHPLEFLTVSERIYRMMTGDSGKCQRRMADYYRDILAKLGYDAKFHITKTIGSGSKDFPPNTRALQKGVHYSDEALARVRQIRPRLLPKFQRLSDEDLLIQDMFIVARKPDRTAGG